VLDIDRSGSMIGQPMQDAKDAAVALVNALEMRDHPETKVGLVSHGDPPDSTRLTNNQGQILGRIRNMSPGGQDNLPRSIDESKSLILEERRDNEVESFDVIVVLSDGGQTYPPAQAVAAAAKAKAMDILLVAVCLENGTVGGCQAMRQIASSNRYYFEARGTSGLTRIFRDIAEEVRDVNLRSLTIEETLPESVELVPDSAAPTPMFDETGRVMSWQYRFVPASGESFRYEVAPRTVATHALAVSTVTFRDNRNNPGNVRVPMGVLTVSQECPLPDVPTPTHTPTSTPVPPSPTPVVPTATPRPTNTPVPPTPTRVPEPIYLPILNLGRCLERDRPSHVALVIDASTSMEQPTSGGRSKLEAAKDGARAFVALMRPVDRTAIVAFNSIATTLAPLTADRAALEAAIGGIAPSPHTRIDLALRAGADALADATGEPIRAIVLLTDGLPSQTTPQAVRDAAADARARGIAIFTIGVGADVDMALLADVAADPSRAFSVDDGEALADIYRQISAKIPCP